MIGTLAWTLSFALLVYWWVSLRIVDLGHRERWRSITEPLREYHHALPSVAFIGGWVVWWMLLAAVPATVTFLAVFFGVPYLTAKEHGSTSWDDASGLMKALSGAVNGGAKRDGDSFLLPIRVRESSASDVSRIDRAVPIPRRSLLALGASGSGKSETLKHVVDQLNTDPTEPVVVFDMKDDYREFLESRGVPIVRLSATGSTETWNLFRELGDESDADELARALFASAEADDSFFGTAGRQLFAAVVKYLDRELDAPDNAALKRYFERTDPETMHDDLRSDGHEDLVSAAAAIDPDAGRQSAGVYATAQQRVNDLLVDDFAAADGEFSIREYMANPQGCVLVLDYPSRQAATIAPVFKQLLDAAIMHGMAAPDRGAYFVLDEIEHLDEPLDRISELVNVGRGVSCQAILSLQSVAQLRDTYGKERASALLSGMTTSIILRCADAESVEFARSVIGTHFEEYTAHESHESLPGGGSITTRRETRQAEEHDFAKGDFYSFDPGECVVTRQGTGWVHGRVRMLSELEDRDADADANADADASGSSSSSSGELTDTETGTEPDTETGPTVP